MFDITTHQRVGGRQDQEDFMTVIEHYYGFVFSHTLAVFDGHGGHVVAKTCSENLQRVMEETKAGSVPELFKKVFTSLQEMVRDMQGGTTASIVSYSSSSDEVYFATVGDSPVIVIDDAGNVFMSRSHGTSEDLAGVSEAIQRGASFGDGRLYSGYTEDGWKRYGVNMTRALGRSLFDGVLRRDPEVGLIKKPRHVLVASDGITLLKQGWFSRKSQRLFGGIIDRLEDGFSAQDILGFTRLYKDDDNSTAIVAHWVDEEV